MGLDSTYPYEPVDTFTYPAYGVGATDQDTPGHPLEHPPYTSTRASAESFKTYLMYIPPLKPGFERRFVALKEISWYWSGQADWNGQWFGPFAEAAEWSYTADFPPHPTWAYVVQGTGPP